MTEVYLVTGSEDGPIAISASAKRAIDIAGKYADNPSVWAIIADTRLQASERNRRAVLDLCDLRQAGYVEIDGDWATAEVRAMETS